MIKTVIDLEKVIATMKNNDGITLKKQNAITYKSGYQVGISGIEVTTIVECLAAIKTCSGTCGIWFSEGIYYIDYSIRVSTKAEAVRIGKQYNQQSIFKWADSSLIWL